MKPLILIVCVIASSVARSRERNLVTAVSVEARAPNSETETRMEETARGAQDRVLAALESAQHLGSRNYTWLWITPSLGSINGASVRFDFP